MLIIISIATLLWGGVCATFFGVTLYPPLIAIDLSESSRTFMMRLCFWMGAIHLSIAQLWPAVGLFPDLRFLNRVGWAVFIWGMLGVVQMFVLKTPLGWDTPWPYLLLAGAALAIVFAEPSRNVGKMLLLGLANFPLSMLSAFSDVISYVRLMAVGLASSVLGGQLQRHGPGDRLLAAGGLGAGGRAQPEPGLGDDRHVRPWRAAQHAGILQQPGDAVDGISVHSLLATNDIRSTLP